MEPTPQLIISVSKEQGNKNKVKTITAAELKEVLEELKDDTQIIIAFDHGGYGGIHYGWMEESDTDCEKF